MDTNRFAFLLLLASCGSGIPSAERICPDIRIALRTNLMRIDRCPLIPEPEICTEFSFRHSWLAIRIDDGSLVSLCTDPDVNRCVNLVMRRLTNLCETARGEPECLRYSSEVELPVRTDPIDREELLRDVIEECSS